MSYKDMGYNDIDDNNMGYDYGHRRCILSIQMGYE